MAWTPEQYAEYLRQQNAKAPTAKPSKHKNVRTLCDGFWFHSKHEADYWLVLKSRQERGEILGLDRQVKFPLLCPDRLAEGQCAVVADYVADYTFITKADGKLHIVDAKGAKKRICPYPLKKLWLELQEHLIIEEV